MALYGTVPRFEDPGFPIEYIYIIIHVDMQIYVIQFNSCIYNVQYHVHVVVYTSKWLATETP